jgi:hypothetical protein
MGHRERSRIPPDVTGKLPVVASIGERKIPYSPDLLRRSFVTAAAAAYALSFIPPARSAPADDAGREAFMATSMVITGRDTLDAAQSARLYDALAGDDAKFADGMRALAALLDQQKIDPLQLQHLLDTTHPELAPLPRRIATAWFTGIVGEGEGARCVAYETSLMYVITNDRLRPPSYCYGVYGSWAEKPV